MWNIVRFLAKHNAFFTWVVLATASFFLLCERNPYQRSVWLSSANVVTGAFHSFVNNFTGYFGLREINEDLLARNGELEAENLVLREQLRRYGEAERVMPEARRQYDFTVAHVVSNSIIQPKNYITLDKGEADGLRADLGVADHNGIVGIIAATSQHFALVISVLNPMFRMSAKLQDSEFFGSLVWDGKDSRHVLLQDLPRNLSYQIGDTVVTTGFSTSFPEGVPVGRVVELLPQSNNNFVTLRVALFTDFGRLNDVHVILNALQEEQQALEAGRKP